MEGEHIGAARHERSTECVGQSNGYRERSRNTRVGTVELKVPRVRNGGYFPSLLKPRRRAERAPSVEEITRLRDELRRLVYDNSPWFEPQTEGKMTPVLKEVGRRYAEHTDALKSGDAARIAESG